VVVVVGLVFLFLGLAVAFKQELYDARYLPEPMADLMSVVRYDCVPIG
jgi:hypothetical protein